MAAGAAPKKAATSMRSVCATFRFPTLLTFVAMAACDGSAPNTSSPPSGTTAGVGGSVTAQVGGTGGIGSGPLATSPTTTVGGTTGTASTTPAGGSVGTGGSSSAGPSIGGSASGGASSASGGATRGGASSAVQAGGSGGNSSAGSSASGGAKGGTTSTGGTTGTAGSTATKHWVSTWTASPYVDTNTNNTPPISLSGSVIRQVAHVSLGGSQLRVQYSNLFGNGPLTINSAHLALCKAAPAVDSTIDTATDKALAFSGSASVTVPQGQEIWSDPIEFSTPNQGNITITTAFGNVPSTLTQHSGSRTTSYFQASSTAVSAANMNSAQKKDLWFFISGIDVMAAASAGAIVAIGDSITDGRGTDTNYNNRWTDVLAARLQANAATANIAIANQGIGATVLAGGASTSAQTRFKRDVLGQSGIKYVIVYDGVNDIDANVTYATMKTAYDDLISRAHAQGLTIYGATILPFSGNNYYSVAHESVRQQVNTYVKSGAFDGYIDFDAALTDGGNPPKLQATYATWAQTDWLHPSPAGYKKMGDSVSLTLFTK